ncbi:hypothetical protein [Pelosinus fermentans]|uniref:hypothetical protein n=1 Tax=Pelosinus fermentans TaxID=365349 RepID=UPI0002F805B5|nr:hypothetical protein [Pelosinus fermentans]
MSSSNFLHKIFTLVGYDRHQYKDAIEVKYNVGLTYDRIGSDGVFMVLSYKSS